MKPLDDKLATVFAWIIFIGICLTMLLVPITMVLGCIKLILLIFGV